MVLLKLAASVAGTLGAYALYGIGKAIYYEFTSALRQIPGPNSSHWFYGNMKELLTNFSEDSSLEEEWVKQYGTTLRLNRFFGSSQLYTQDIKALQHVLTNDYLYQKSEQTRFELGRIVGPGILVVEGDVHKRQRKIMNPAFGAPQVRALTGIFVEKSLQLRDIWASQIAKGGGVARVEILSWFSKATLDIIGLAGFNYDINALGAESVDKPNELAHAFETIVTAEGGMTFMRFLRTRVRLLRKLPTKMDKTVQHAQDTMMRIGRGLLRDSKKEIAENGTVDTGRARDLLSLLVRANTAKDIPASQQLSDEDVLAQVPTFLVAGHETTSTAATWALFALTQNVAAQTRLREELLTVSTDTPTMDELNALPYLDCVVRETLRLYAPVTATSRVAMRDDVLPLATPYTDRNGTVHETLQIPKGHVIVIPILSLNRDVKIWGPDAMEFKPERWDSDTPIPSVLPGVWGHMLSFLGGPRACIGYRFSLVELKALLFTLVRAFEFELAVPLVDVGKKSTAIVQRPMVISEPEVRNQLPLLVRPFVGS
ncbi:cytochrome P450 [Mycena sp. CBHHK59/15]|nr:cytochrome P450 [Mycena sp. CBHHK59/15]